jgi:hypothetical protein
MSVDEIFQKLLTGRPRGPVLPMTAEELFRRIRRSRTIPCMCCGFRIRRRKKMRENELDVVNIRLVPDRTYLSDRPIRCPDDAIPFIAEHLADYDREVLAILT